MMWENVCICDSPVECNPDTRTNLSWARNELGVVEPDLEDGETIEKTKRQISDRPQVESA